MLCSAACGDDRPDIEAQTGVPHSDGGDVSGDDAQPSVEPLTDASDGPDGAGQPATGGPPDDLAPDASLPDASLPDALDPMGESGAPNPSVDTDASAPPTDDPDSANPRGEGGDFEAPDALTHLVYSTPGCSSAYPNGLSESPATYELVGRRLTATAATGRRDEYDIAIEMTPSGLVQHVGLYLPQSGNVWRRSELLQGVDEAGAVEWRISTGVDVEFSAALPFENGAPCSVVVDIELEYEGVEPEGVFVVELGPYACTHEKTAQGQLIRLPESTTEELAQLESGIQGRVRDVRPTVLRLPRPDTEYLLRPGGYQKIDESEVQR
jgi:hypothetical protein